MREKSFEADANKKDFLNKYIASSTLSFTHSLQKFLSKGKTQQENVGRMY